MTDKKRRRYVISSIIFNGRIYTEVIIDPHYELNHRDQINDDLILSLVMLLNDSYEVRHDQRGNYSYFVKKLKLAGKNFRLIWVTEKGNDYIGVINTFRDSRGEK